MDSTGLPLILLAIGSAWMAALGWFTQTVHYPTFALIAPSEWPNYHQFHCNRIAPIVGIGIALQTLGLVLLCLSGTFTLGSMIVHAVLFALTVGWTAAVSIHAHHKLAQQCEPAVLRTLIRTSTVRSLGWAVQMGVASAQLIFTPNLF